MTRDTRQKKFASLLREAGIAAASIDNRLGGLRLSQFFQDVENYQGAHYGHDEAGGVDGLAFLRLREEAGNEAACDRADNTDERRFEKAHVHVHDGARNEADEKTDDDGPNDVEHRRLSVARLEEEATRGRRGMQSWRRRFWAVQRAMEEHSLARL